MVIPRQAAWIALAKVNGPHGSMPDDLAACKCTHRRHQHVKGKCACGCVEFKEVSRVAFVIYDFRHTFATRAAESDADVSFSHVRRTPRIAR